MGISIDIDHPWVPVNIEFGLRMKEEDQVPYVYNPWDWVVQLYPQALCTHFSRLLRHV